MLLLGIESSNQRRSRWGMEEVLVASMDLLSAAEQVTHDSATHSHRHGWVSPAEQMRSGVLQVRQLTCLLGRSILTDATYVGRLRCGEVWAIPFQWTLYRFQKVLRHGWKVPRVTFFETTRREANRLGVRALYWRMKLHVMLSRRLVIHPTAGTGRGVERSDDDDDLGGVVFGCT
ncbi:hypothetical protein B0T22DRAFT_119810 [Podospora appendiculata]|uniref:Uncharacterized protein n=1 Tax=Podospora appendiculata TaxID=314037 RepID=A0AAE0WYK4_9PEZI|nr:hypothetical protein B0T22DRAFT_119810 [Podospora appendiculata]